MRKEIGIIILIFFLLNAGFVVYAVIKKRNCDKKVIEAEYNRQSIRKQAEIDSLQAAGETLKERMRKDSIEFQDRLNRINKQIKRLKDNARKINYKNYLVPDLDSVGRVLYPRPVTDR